MLIFYSDAKLQHLWSVSQLIDYQKTNKFLLFFIFFDKIFVFKD